MVPLINRKNELEIDNVFGLSTKHLKKKSKQYIGTTSWSYRAVFKLLKRQLLESMKP